MNYVESFNLLGVEAKQIPCIKGQGAPATATEGTIGCFYMDQNSGTIYKCVAVNDGEYIWVNVHSDNNAVLHTPQTILEVQKAQARDNVGLSESSTIRNAELSELWAAVLALGDAAKDYPVLLGGQAKWYKSSVGRRTITEIHIVPTYTPTGSEESWNGDADNSGTIKVYRDGTVVTISAEGNGKIRLPSDGSYIFLRFESLESIDGLEYIDASHVTVCKGVFYGCRSLVHLDVSSWKMPNVRDTRQFACECNSLKSFHFSKYGTPNLRYATDSSGNTVGATLQMCGNDFCLEFADLGRDIPVIGNEMFLHCFDLKTVLGLGSVSEIMDRAFVYTPSLHDVDIVARNINTIGESTFRLTGIEDTLDLSVVPTENVGDMATRNKRWDADTLKAINGVDIPSVYFEVPNMDNQKKYAGITFGTRADGTVLTIANAGCSAFALYHAWNALYAGTSNVYSDFPTWWNAKIVPTGFVENNTWSTDNDVKALISALGWTPNNIVYVNDEAQLQSIVDRLQEGYPVFANINSANTEENMHAVLIVGCDKNTRKLAIVDSSAKFTGDVSTGIHEGLVSWIAYEDIFAETHSKDYIRLIDFGDAPPIA